jgi:hypothetical protein
VSGPTGQGPCPVVASPRRGKSRVGGKDGTKAQATALESLSPNCQEKPGGALTGWCPYRKPTLVGR